MCSQGESKQAPLPHTISGSGLSAPNWLTSWGLKTVCVGSEASANIRALYGPVPPSSITRLLIISDQAGFMISSVNNIRNKWRFRIMYFLVCIYLRYCPQVNRRFSAQCYLAFVEYVLIDSAVLLARNK